MAEIEPSSRLYEQNGALYMTMSALYGVEDGQPRSDPIGFVLTGNRLVTVRYVDAEAGSHLRTTMRAATAAIVRDALDRALCVCSMRSSTGSPTSSKKSGAEIEKISAHIFAQAVGRAAHPGGPADRAC